MESKGEGCAGAGVSPAPATYYDLRRSATIYGVLTRRGLGIRTPPPPIQPIPVTLRTGVPFL